MSSSRSCFTTLPLKPRYTSGIDNPLVDFYIPVLRRAQHYDRAVGYFSSTALIVAAQGIAHLIADGGTMRLLVGAELSYEDVEAILQGEKNPEAVMASALEPLLPDPEALADRIARQRLEALAWMVAQGLLTIRVVIPATPNFPHAYFHIKTGVLTDACGHTIAFHGSMNETATAWQKNYEDFSVFCSWKPGEAERVKDFQDEFERIWRNKDRRWRAYPLPDAVRCRLLKYKPDAPPQGDPLERVSAPTLAGELRGPSRPQLLARFLRDAPYFPNAEALGAATSTVQPWPHQTFVLRHILHAYPQRFLLADEVGLGKTIEAGLVLRQLWLAGLAKRVLILTPKSVLRQWQEELYEKFNLQVPIYDGHRYITIDGQHISAPSGTTAWEEKNWLLASAQLVRRKERQRDLLEAKPWDVVIVDEAHHARRRDFQNLNRYRPNRLLDLLQRLSRRTEFLLLLTATPMQVHPIEVWDLLNLLGLSGGWALEHGKAFLDFFDALEQRPPRWQHIIPLLRDELNTAGSAALQEALSSLSGSQRLRLKRLLTTGETGELRRLPKNKREELEQKLLHLARRNTPLRRLVLRHTRDLLRHYREQGLLDAPVPRRRPEPRWVPMTEAETALYHDVSEYIATFYRRYEETRRGLGFVMTVYRRRLTSSLYALRRSLERRLLALRRRQALLESEDEESAETLFLEDDLEGAPEAFPKVDALPEAVRDEEIQALEALLGRMHALGDHDSKSEQLLQDLQRLLTRRDKILIFTQYTDTMDYLRERLKEVYGQAVACYSGRGGERWDGNNWVSASKEDVKNAFREGAVKILLATDAASEGLNLQTCGVLINYDMPWNPMRVEQRIGRIDRIGQVHEEVWIYHYFYEGTIEEKVYRRLGERIGFFQQVVGPLQPILMRVEDILQRVAVLPVDEQAEQLKRELANLEREATTTSFNLDEWAGVLEHPSDIEEPPWTPEGLDAWLKADPTLQVALTPERDGRYRLEIEKGKAVIVTFLPEVFDTHPDTVHLLTYGSPYWDAWLQALSGKEQLTSKETTIDNRLLILHADGPPPTIGWYVLTSERKPQRVRTLDALRYVLTDWDTLPVWDEEAMRAARSDFERVTQARAQRLANNRQVNARLFRSALIAQGRALLHQAGALALALAQPHREPLFSGGMISAGEVWRLVFQWGEPFTHLLEKLRTVIPKEKWPVISEQDVHYNHYVAMHPRELTKAQQRLQRQVKAWLEVWERINPKQ